MRVEQEAARILLWLSKEEFQALETSMEARDRITLESLHERGLYGYALDFPRNKFIAVLDPRELIS